MFAVLIDLFHPYLSLCRLSIAPEPFLILQQHALVTTHRPTLHLVLQTCPLQETLYLGAGYLGSSSDLENPALFLGGAGGVAGGAAKDKNAAAAAASTGTKVCWLDSSAKECVLR